MPFTWQRTPNGQRVPCSPLGLMRGEGTINCTRLHEKMDPPSALCSRGAPVPLLQSYCEAYHESAWTATEEQIATVLTPGITFA